MKSLHKIPQDVFLNHHEAMLEKQRMYESIGMECLPVDVNGRVTPLSKDVPGATLAQVAQDQKRRL